MIGKVPKPGKGFKGLVSYLLHGDRKCDKDRARVAWIETRNLLIEDVQKAPGLMRATAGKSRRVKAPVYHYVISWHRDEKPSDELMRQVADVTCEDLGLEEYQRLYIAHRDTEHRHVHIVVNRVHPETGKAWRTSHDYRRIEQSLRRQSEALGLHYVPGRHNDPERFFGKPKRARDSELQQARREGRSPPLPQWDKAMIARRRPALQQLFAEAGDWDQLEGTLTAAGLRLEAKGQGMVIADNTGAMKLSQLGKQIRLKDLEQRFGQSWKARAAQIALREQAGRDAAWETMTKLQAETDMTFALHRMGLANRDEVERAVAARERAGEAVDRHRSLGERLKRDLATVGKAEPERRRAPLRKRMKRKRTERER